MQADNLFSDIVKEAENDPNIIGLILSGSRGKGLFKEYSDYDFLVVVKEEAVTKYKDKFDELDKKPNFDCSALGLNEFRDYAKW